MLFSLIPFRLRDFITDSKNGSSAFGRRLFCHFFFSSLSIRLPSNLLLLLLLTMKATIPKLWKTGEYIDEEKRRKKNVPRFIRTGSSSSSAFPRAAVRKKKKKMAVKDICLAKTTKHKSIYIYECPSRELPDGRSSEDGEYRTLFPVPCLFL